MIRVFCDCCGQEITSTNNIGGDHPLGRLTAIVRAKSSADSMTVEILTSKGGVSNSGHFCKYCIIDAINRLDDRPRIYDQTLAKK